MRRDLIIGIIVSLAFHAGIGWGGEIWKHLPKKTATKAKDDTVLVDFKPPPIEPDEQESETPSDNQQTVQEQSFAPPSLVDVPGTVDINTFTQALQPPPPPNVNISHSLTIPKGNPNVNTTRINDVFSVKDLDQQLQEKPGSAKPVYPYELKRSGISGSVAVEFIVDVNGVVIDASVMKSTHREFEQPAIAAVMKWKFRPGKKGGKPVKVRVQRLIQFNLDNED